MKTVVIGGNAAGMSAASRLRRYWPDVKVTVFEKSGEVSYGSCGLPYFISGENPDVDLVRIRKPDAFRQAGVCLRLFHNVTRVDTGEKLVAATDMLTGETVQERYDKLIVASGASPIRLDLPGSKGENIFYLKTISDAERIKGYLNRESTRRVSIIGGGYIGLELAEACIKQKKELCLFEAAPHCLANFDPAFGLAAQEMLAGFGASVYTGTAVKAFEEAGGKVRAILTADNRRYGTDMVIVAVGVRPNTQFIPSVETLNNGAILTDPAFRTSVPDVYAVGDCATVFHKLLQKPVYLPLATNANKQGRFAAGGVMGEGTEWGRALGTSMLRCLTLEFGKTGLTETEARTAGFAAESITVKAQSHARYYPGSAELTLKLCYDSATKAILGAQVMGEREAAWRIDVLALAVDRGMTCEELGALDLAYCPVFSTVWDPVLIAANAVK